MRHKVAGRLFGRTANQRKALLRGLVSSLFEHQRIETTVAKAKAIRGIAEKLVTFGKRGDLHAKRMVFSYIPNRAIVAKLFSEIAPRFANRNGGYLRIIQTRLRINDRAPMAIIEFVDYEQIRPKPAKKASKEDKKTEEKKAVEKKAEEKPAEKPAAKKAVEKKTADKAAEKPKKATKKAADEKPKKAASKATAEAEEKPKKPAAKKTAKKAE
jgi:large subunit ribosomal protein L17